ncbi:MAG: hypothetical protein HY064_10215 [Bacteroidetes bacterium]|nr:hypothetical protein [Bacteroidota bacterium]
MKKFILPLIAFFPVQYASAQTAKQNDLAADNMKGKVAMVTQKYYQVLQTAAGKDSVGQEWEMTDHTYIMAYTDKGYVAWANFYKTGSFLDYRYVFKYDDAGNRIEETWFDSDNALDYRLTRKYSPKGFIMEMKKYSDTAGTYDEKTVYEPDPVGNPLKATLYDGNDAVVQTTSYKYDEYGNCTEEDNFDAKGKPLGKLMRTFDSRHLKTSEDAYTGDGAIMTKQKYQYEYRGHLSQQQNFDNNSKLVEKNVFVYNDNADQSEWTNFDRTGFVMYNYTYTYEYDSTGNWTKQYQLKDGKTVFLSTREVKYY